MMFRLVQTPFCSAWRTLDLLARYELAALANLTYDDYRDVSGLPFDQLIEQARILADAPTDCQVVD